eukprot:scaffold142019_cov25-Prasinocladus_malaysianus.AAC.1
MGAQAPTTDKLSFLHDIGNTKGMDPDNALSQMSRDNGGSELTGPSSYLLETAESTKESAPV